MVEYLVTEGTATGDAIMTLFATGVGSPKSTSASNPPFNQDSHYQAHPSKPLRASHYYFSLTRDFKRILEPGKSFSFNSYTKG